MLGQALGGISRRTTEPVEAEAEAIAQLLLPFVEFGAVLRDRQPGLGRGEFGRCPVFVGGADMQHLVAPKPQVAGVGVGGQHGADEISEMLDAVDVGEGGGDQVPGHRGLGSAGVSPVSYPPTRLLAKVGPRRYAASPVTEEPR